ncbi:hypothetical protein AL755_19960 [Arthrobacter sp. ERGS1:01]|nr:hypothetical protein AL755_19960 [Arthrobacter sp. ERGS1:01]
MALAPFEVLVAEHGAVVLRVCRALVGVQEADDVWQETFMAALRAYPGSGDVRNREAWLVAIARNKAIDHHRKAGRLPIPADDFPGEFGGAGVSGGVGTGARSAVDSGSERDGVERAAEAGQEAALVWSALAALPPKQREAVVYHHLAGLRYAEVAALLGNSEAAARRAAADGMKALRALLLEPTRSGQ